MQRRCNRQPVRRAEREAVRHPACLARRVLAGQLALAGTLVLAVLVREFPGLVREVRIWRMVGFGSGSRYPH